MSADPARPATPEPANTPATILTFRRRPHHTSGQPSTPHQPEPHFSPELKLAASIERAFAGHGRSLTDDDTALDYTITLAVFRKLLEGARQEGTVSQNEFDTLTGMVDAMLAAPRLLA